MERILRSIAAAEQASLDQQREGRGRRSHFVPAAQSWGMHSFPQRRRQRLATAGLFGISLFVLGLGALHVAAFGNEPPHMSQFAHSRFRLFWVMCLSAFILGTALLVWALGPCLGKSRAKRAGITLLSLAGTGGLLLAGFPMGAARPLSLTGAIHEGAAVATFVLLGAAMLVLVPAFRSSRGLARFAGASLALGILVNVSLVVYFVSSFEQSAVRGPAQRALVAFITAWFTLLALRLRALTPTPLGPRRFGDAQ